MIFNKIRIILIGLASIFNYDSAPTDEVKVIEYQTEYVYAEKYSEGEEFDEAKKRRVGILIGSVIYIQLVLLMVFLIKPLLIAGAVLLLALRILKETAKGVSAS